VDRRDDELGRETPGLPTSGTRLPAGAAAPSPWHRLSTREVYRNAWMTVREDIVRRPDGREGIYGVVTLAGAVGVLPFVDDDHVLLVQQWRYLLGRATWEMPTGGVHPDEALDVAAQRELAEEVGYRAGRLLAVSTFSTSKSVVDEMATLFLGFDLEPADGDPDDTEHLVVGTFAFDDVLAMVLDGDIVDAMTIVAVLLADRIRRQ
jgi:ADP-ribose pyrophosphatase